VERNKKEALRWFRAAAKQGEDNAQYFLGEMYYTGDGVAQNFADAAIWFTKAAEQGHLNAQCYLGEMYKDGIGVNQDYAEAFRWLSESAAQGHSIAQRDLALMYRDGIGVQRNIVQAYMWFAIVASNSKYNGDKDSSHDRDEVAKSMTAADIAKAQRLAADFKPKGKKGREDEGRNK